MSLVDSLKQLGLTDNEAKIYLSSLRIGTSIASRLSVQTGINRATVYPVLKTLIQKGFVKKITRSGVDQFEATNPLVLKSLIETQTQKALQEFEVKRETVESLIPQLESIPLTKESLPRVQFIEGSKNIGKLYMEALDVFNGFVGVFNPQIVLPPLEKLVRRMIEYANDHQSEIREIAVDGPWTQTYLSWIDNPNHSVRLLDASHPFDGDFILTKKSVYHITHKPYPVAVAISSEGIVSNQLLLFDTLWRHLTPSNA